LLTRLPSGLAVAPTDAAHALAIRFGGSQLRLPETDRCELPSTLAGAGVFGGASYDGLVALEADAHGHVLLSLDRRAQGTYRRLRVAFEAL
jgi:toxin FitB